MADSNRDRRVGLMEMTSPKRWLRKDVYGAIISWEKKETRRGGREVERLWIQSILNLGCFFLIWQGTGPTCSGTFSEQIISNQHGGIFASSEYTAT